MRPCLKKAAQFKEKAMLYTTICDYSDPEKVKNEYPPYKEHFILPWAPKTSFPDLGRSNERFFYSSGALNRALLKYKRFINKNYKGFSADPSKLWGEIYDLETKLADSLIAFGEPTLDGVKGRFVKNFVTNRYCTICFVPEDIYEAYKASRLYDCFSNDPWAPFFRGEFSFERATV
jgi:hypothetical protein